MEIEMVMCECCGLKEDCTQFYISEVKAKFEGKWLCGLCSEAVRDEAVRLRGKMQVQCGLDEAVVAHMSFCRQYKLNPVQVADGMKQLLRRLSGSRDTSESKPAHSSNKYSRSSTTPIQVFY